MKIAVCVICWRTAIAEHNFYDIMKKKKKKEMSRYLKSNSHVTLVFQAEKNSNKSRNMGSCKICYKLLRKQCVLIIWAGGPDGKYLAHGDNLRTSLRLVHTAWPAEPNIFPSDPTLPVDTHLSVRLPSFSFFLSSYIFSSLNLAGTYTGLCLLVPLRTFLIPGFFFKCYQN